MAESRYDALYFLENMYKGDNKATCGLYLSISNKMIISNIEASCDRC